MNSTDMSNLWLGTDLTCRMGTRNLPAPPHGELWVRCHLAVDRRHSLGSRGWHWQRGSAPTTPRCSLCSGLPRALSEARDAPQQPGCGQGWLSLPWDSPGFRGSTGRGSCAGRGPAALLPTLVGNRKGKVGHKGKMMSRKLQEGQRENQQACYWKQSIPKFSKLLLPAALAAERGPRCSSALQRLLTYSHRWAAPITCLCLAFSDELLNSDAVAPQYLLCLWQLRADELPCPDPWTRRSWVPTAEPVFPSLLCLTSRQLKIFFSLEHDPHFWKLVHLPGEALCVLQSIGTTAWSVAEQGCADLSQERAGMNQHAPWCGAACAAPGALSPPGRRRGVPWDAETLQRWPTAPDGMGCIQPGSLDCS